MTSENTEDRGALLEAENASLKGKLAGAMPGPTRSNGTVVTPMPTKIRSMRDAYRAAAIELGWRSRD